MDGRTAGGTVWAAYRDLDVQMVDRKTGEGGVFDDIKSFVTNTFVLRGDNMPGDGEDDEARPGASSTTSSVTTRSSRACGLRSGRA